jgi:putative Mn2+ efflux pump MntP
MKFSLAQELLLVGTVAVVGVLHTLVPDHWVPITLLARRQGWTQARVARIALAAGFGHVLSTLAIGVLVWLIGTAFAEHFGRVVSVVSSIALVIFGLWVMLRSIRELRHQRECDQVPCEHGPGPSRLTLVLILGSSPMVEGIPAFFAASRYGAALLAIMAAVFTITSVATYVLLCVGSSAGISRISLGPIEPYGEVLSGAIITLLGIVFIFVNR